ncbi:cytosolic phospholipase A2-like [Lineus longissimus]|uniref:cytosolic phospholipase A2-like n=1 Tax=Lineus longissimus TaxID=88925 RepID=UPI00315D5401
MANETRKQRAGSVKKMLSSIANIKTYSLDKLDHPSPAVYCPGDVLTVHVIRGRKITHGYLDYVDTPDPFLKLLLPTAAIPCRRTRHVDNCTDPTWDEQFTFFIDSNEKNVLDISLMDANYLGLHQTVDKIQFDIKELSMDQKFEKTFTLNNGSEIDMAFTLSSDTAPPDLRFSLFLCEQEEQFLRTRRKVVFKNMQMMFGIDGPRAEDEVPKVSIIGSGGGFRAMVGLAGVFKALADNNIIDVATYIGALSGSSWYLSTLYSEPNFPDTLSPSDPAWLQNFKEKIDQSLLWLLTPTQLLKYAGYLKEKSGRGQPVTFTDIFGLLVGETLIQDRMDKCLSDQRNIVDNGSVPMPLYEGLHVKKDVSASIFGEHVEMNPYEVGMESYGVYMDTTLFGSAFFGGKLVKKFPEAKLHYLQGILGSAFTILFKKLKEKDDPNSKLYVIESKIREEMHKRMEEEYKNEEAAEPEPDYNEPENTDDTWTGWISGFLNTSEYFNNRGGRAALIHSFLKNIKFDADAAINRSIETGVSHLKKLFLVDAGLSFNSPFPMVLREHRNVDLILSFDFSARESYDAPPFSELLLAEMWARDHNKPFPPIDLSVFEKYGQQELYVFEHPTDLDCPIVLHFPLVNKAFREFKSPGVQRETEEEREFANFDLFVDDSPYSTFNFNYPHEAFDRLVKLMEFNTLYKMPEIKEAILRRINLKRGVNTPMSPAVYENVE